MPDSLIASIYLAIANLAIGGVKSRNLPEAQLAIEQADLPIRILLPSTKGDGSFVLVGSVEKVSWSIRDLCLWAPIDKDLVDVAEPMLRYITAYLTALKALRGPTSQSHVAGFDFQIAPIEWNGASYWAVDATLSVEEVL